MQGSYGMIPGGNILVSSFVKLSTTANQVLQCGSGDKVFGISQGSTRRIALDPYDTGGSTSLCGQLGDPAINIYGPGDPGVLLQLGGTVTRGDYLKPDTNGCGITAGTDKDGYGARALASGTVGQLIPVEVVVGCLSI